MTARRTLLLVALALLALTLLGSMALAEREVLKDDFEVPGAPDPAKWKSGYGAPDGWDVAVVANGVLRTASGYDGLMSYVSSVRKYSCDNLTLHVMYRADSLDGTPLDVAIEMDDGIGREHALQLYYDGRWNYRYFHDGEGQANFTGLSGLRTGVWYAIELSIVGGTGSIVVTDTGASTTAFSSVDIPLDPLMTRVFATFGVRSRWATDKPDATWDNFTLVDPTAPPNAAPQWLDVPTLEVTQGEAASFDLSPYIEDDQEPWELELSSTSPNVTSINGLRVGVLFPDGPVTVDVPFEVFDGYARSGANVTFMVHRYNAPPQHDLPESIEVMEGVPTRFDITDHVWDPDDPASSLTVTTTSPFVVVDGLVLNITIPEGWTRYELRIIISDGANEVGALIVVNVIAFNAPPVLDPLPDLDLVEDISKTVDLTRYIHDPDTPFALLRLTVDDPNCTVSFPELTFRYRRGGINRTVLVELSDGYTAVNRTMRVNVTEVDDPPYLWDVPKLTFTEEKREVVLLHPYVFDEDTPVSELVLRCTDPAVVDIDGLIITFNFTKWLQFKEVQFSVSDGNSTVYGFLYLEVKNVNDPPRIHSVGMDRPPIELTVYALSTKTFDVVVYDEEGGAAPYPAKLSLVGSPTGVSVSGQTLRVNVLRSQIGTHTFTLVAADSQGAADNTTITLTVLDPYSAPITIMLRMPANHSIVVVGDSVTFAVEATHALLDPTRTTTATWTSDIQGNLGTARTEAGVLAIVVHDLEPGLHTITVTATQGDLYGSMWFELEVEEAEPVDMVDTDFTWLYLCITSVIIVIIIIVLIASRQSQIAKSKAQLAEVSPRKPPPPTPAARAGSAAPPATSTYYVAPGRPTIEVVTPMPPSSEEVAAMPRLPTAAPAPEVTEEEIEEALAPPPEEVVPVPEPEPMAEWKPPEQPIEVAPVEETSLVPETAPAMPPPPPPPPPTPTPAVASILTARETPAPDIARLVEAIRARPGGVPHYLALFDEQSLARRILTGRKGTDPEGKPIVQIMGDWYYSDPDDAETFLSQWEE